MAKGSSETTFFRLLKTPMDDKGEALAIDREIGSRWGEAADLGDLGLVYRHNGELDKALEHHQEALAILGAIGRPGEADKARRHIAELQEQT
jgi:hypothetical protein